MIAVLNKVFRILEVFVELGDPVSLADLTSATRLPKPTVYRIVQSLVELGYVIQEPRTGAYMRTPALGRLGRNGRDEYLRLRLRPIIDKLHAQFDETTAVAVLSDRIIAYLLVRESRRPLRRITREGDGEPYHNCALGHVIAAFLPAAEQRELIERTRFRCASREGLLANKSTFQKSLKEIRERGWAVDEQECDEGVIGLAVPVLDGDRAIASLGLFVPSVRMDPIRQQAMIKALLQFRAA